MFYPFRWRQQPSLEDVDTPIADGSCIIFPLRTKQKTETAAASQVVLVVLVWLVWMLPTEACWGGS